MPIGYPKVLKTFVNDFLAAYTLHNTSGEIVGFDDILVANAPAPAPGQLQPPPPNPYISALTVERTDNQDDFLITFDDGNTTAPGIYFDENGQPVQFYMLAEPDTNNDKTFASIARGATGVPTFNTSNRTSQAPDIRNIFGGSAIVSLFIDKGEDLSFYTEEYAVVSFRLEKHPSLNEWNAVILN